MMTNWWGVPPPLISQNIENKILVLSIPLQNIQNRGLGGKLLKIKEM
jgi:hypothetical protein